MLLMCFFCIGNIFAAFAQNYGLLLLARLVTSLAHGTFVGQQWGWRSSFIVIAIIGMISLVEIIKI